MQPRAIEVPLGGGSFARVEQDVADSISYAATTVRVTALRTHSIQAALPQLLKRYSKGLCALHLAGCSVVDVGAQVLAEAAGSPALRKLQTLELPGNFISATGAEALAGAAFDSLLVLNLGGNYLSAAGAAVLSRSTWRLHLTVLQLRWNAIHDAGVAVLCAEAWPCLVQLDLAQNSISAVGAVALAAACTMGRLPRLSTLYLCRNGLGDEGAAALTNCSWPALNVLSLVQNALRSDGAKALAAGSGHFPELHTLALSYNGLGDDGAVALAAAKYFKRLVKLHLESCCLGSVGLRCLAAPAWAQQMRTLILSGNPDLGAAASLLSSEFQALQKLNLRGTGLTAEAAAQMFSLSSVLPNLCKLDCSGTGDGHGMGDAGLAAMAAARLPCLKQLYLNAADIGDSGARALVAAPWSSQLQVKQVLHCGPARSRRANAQLSR